MYIYQQDDFKYKEVVKDRTSVVINDQLVKNNWK